MSAAQKDSPPFLNIKERQAGDVTVLDLEGNVIMGGGSAELRSAIHRLISEGRKKILLNFAQVKYVDSSGIGELVASVVSIGSRGGQMKLINLSERVDEVMGISNLLSIFEVYDDESKALNDYE